MLRILISVVFFSFVQPILAKDTLPTGKELLEMDLEKSIRVIEGLSKEESKILVSEIRSEAKQVYPKADHFYFLISHLEEIQAIEKEQARLRSLLWVYALAFILFLGFVLFLLVRQRMAIRDINRLLER